MENAAIIPKKSPDYPGLFWVSKAVSKEEDKFGLQLIRISIPEKTAVATDGHRLHEYQIQDLDIIKTGCYRPFAVKGQLILIQELPSVDSFPAYKELFPPYANEPENIGIEFTLHSSDEISPALCKLLKTMDAEHGLNLQYFEEMMSIGDWTVRYYGADKPICFSEQQADMFTHRRGLIMPMRM